MICVDCHETVARVGHDTCFRCHVRSIGFTYRGALYGQDAWHGKTIKEMQRQFEALPNVEPI